MYVLADSQYIWKQKWADICLEIVQVLYAPLRLHRTSFSTFMSFNYKTSSIKSKCHKLLPLYEAALHRPLGGSHRNNIAAKHPKLGKRNFVKGSNGNKLMYKLFAKFQKVSPKKTIVRGTLKWTFKGRRDIRKCGNVCSCKSSDTWAGLQRIRNGQLGD